MSDINQLFGDAKATARSMPGDRKLKQLQLAKEKFEADPNAANQTDLATAYFDVGKYDKALELFNALVDEYGQDIKVLCDLGFSYKNIGKPDKAKEMFLRVIELSPKHALARCAESELWTMDPTYRPSWLKS